MDTVYHHDTAKKSNWWINFSDWLGEFLLRSLLLVGMIIVFGSGIYLSWRHTYHLAANHGFFGAEATAYTLFVEVILIVSEIVVIFKAIQRQKISWQVYLGLGFGLLINGTANVLSSFSYGWLGVAMGVSIPVGTMIAVSIFAAALVRQTTDITTQTDDRQDIDSQTDSVLDKLQTLGIVGKVLMKDKTDTTNEQTEDIQTDNSDKPKDNQTRQDRQQDKIIQTAETDEIEVGRPYTFEEIRQWTTDKKDAQDSTKTGIDSVQTVSDNKQEIDTDQTARQTRDRQTTDSDKTDDSQTTDKKTVQTDTQTRQKNNLSVIQGNKTDSKTSTSRQTDDRPDSDKEKLARQKAMEYYREHGKFPSFRRLGKMVGMNKDKAGEIIKELKTKIS